MNWLNGKRRFFNHQIKKITLRKTIVFMLILAMIFESSFFGAIGKFIFAEEYNDGLEYELYVDTSMVGADAELLEDGIGVYLYDEMGNSCTDFPIIMDQVDGKDHLYKLDLDKQYTYVIFTEGSDPYTEERTDVILVDWELGAPVYRLNSEYLTDGGSFYGLYTVYFDLNNAEGSDAFVENGVGVYAYSSETESYSSLPVAMQKSDKGEGIYEYSFDKPYEFIAFMNGYNTWNYDIATAPVYTEWGYDAPCFLLETVDGEASTGLWRSLNCVVYFDASEIKEDEAFAENGVYLYAYNEKEDGEKEELDSYPVKMLASTKGEDLYEYTLDKPYENVQFVLGDSFDTEIQSEIITIDWLYYAAPCYKMTVDREIIMSEEPSATPSMTPSATPSESPSMTPSGSPSETPSGSPSAEPSGSPTATSSATPSMTPTAAVSVSPEATPSTTPTATPNETPKGTPTVETTPAPVETPEVEPTTEPTEAPEDADEENDEEKIEPIEDLRDDSDVSSSDSEGTKPIEEARINTNGLSAISGSYRMEWLGSESDLIVQPVEEVIKQNTTIATSTPATTPASNDDTTNKTTQTETPTPVKTDDSNETSGSTEESSPAASAMATSTATATPTATPENDETTGEVDVYGEVTDLAEGTATTVPRAATFGLTRSSGTSTTIVYFDTCNNSSDSWTVDGTMYIYVIGGGMDKPVAMTKSTRNNTRDVDCSGTLWEYTIPDGCTKVIFSRQDSWTKSGRDYKAQTIDVTLDSDIQYPCYKLGSNVTEGNLTKKAVEYLGDLGPLSQAGNPMYFVDMTSTVTDVSAVKAEFSGTDITVVDVEAENGAYIVPADVSDIPYDKVTFWDTNNDPKTQLGGYYNFFDDTSSTENAFLYDATTTNTFFYGATEKIVGTSTTLISGWGAQPTGQESLAGKTIYFDKLYFPVASGGQFQIGDGTPITLSPDANDEKTFSYTFPDDTTATQETILTFIATDESGNITKYHFIWSDFNANAVALNNDIASVTNTYYKAVTVYFDATMSKLSYSGTTGALNSGNGIPYADTENVYYYATKEDGSSTKGKMEKVANDTWQDVYKADLPEGYSKIRFAGYEVANEDAAANGDGTAMYEIPVDLNNPCFYADTSDQVIYNGGNRSGYWAEVYTIRDAEEYKEDRDVVDIATGTFTRASDVLYVDSTFYDYYTDFELNGHNRDEYNVKNGASQRNYVTFRQFDQALSDYYEDNSVEIPIYTGHFQPSYSNWRTRFADIASTLDLYGYSNYNKFFSTNNSTLNIGGDGTYYDCASQGLVSSSLSGDELIVKNGTVLEPHFNKDFLTGNNSKNAVLGEVYENVAFPFTSKDRDNNGVKYWVFDSAQTTLAMRQDTAKNQYYLADVGNQGWSQNVNSDSQTSGAAGTVSNRYGFFPFNETSTTTHANTYNYGFGTKLEFKFRLTSDGTVQASDGNDVPITFTFSGDDDVWVFIDDQLALDVGGAHGRVTGKLDFATKKATVSQVKASAGSTTSGLNVTADFSLVGANTDEHTLTMYYMERGMWESNMSISFNFPDENQLEVEKQVDETDVNQELFAGIFDDASIFTYTIRNLATHYPYKEVTASVESKEVTFNDTFSSVSATSSSNTFAQVSSYEGRDNVVHWKAKYNDASGSYKTSRYGVIPYMGGDNADTEGANKYLQFKYYYAGTGTPALSDMYIALVDSGGQEICRYLSGMVYGSATTKSKTWTTITIDLDKFIGTTDFNRNAIQYIKFGYDYEADFYLDDFTFKSASAISTLTGFVTKQYDIPDYGSANSGQLVYPKGAVYTLTTSDGDSSYGIIDEDGTFVLADGESVLFRDQFRRGSYIALEEEVNAEVFATSWTMYENGEAVVSTAPSSGNTNTTVTNDNRSLKDVALTVVVDGRVENYSNSTEDGKVLGNAYTGTKPTDPTFVFRSYSIPDTTTGMTKLKVVYTNKVKTGYLTIKKTEAKGSDPLTGDYTFLITFTNVAGMGLEGDTPITKTVTLNKDGEATISGIPVNTEFTITETASDKSFLNKVTEANDQEFTFDYETKELKGKITSEGQAFDFTYENMLKPVINIELEKKWQSANPDDESPTDIPEYITIRLQRREKGTETWEDFNIDYQDVRTQEELDKQVTGKTLRTQESLKPGYDGWNRIFTDLHKYVDNTAMTKVLWEYRVVEVDSGNPDNIISEGGVLGNFQVYYDPDSVVGKEAESADTDTEDETYSYTITNISTVTLQITKKNKTGDAIAGVSFTLEKQDSSGGWIKVSTKVTDPKDNSVSETYEVTTDSSGIGTFVNLPYGTYRLTETKTAEGYTLLKDPIIIEIGEKGYKLDSETNYTNIENNLVTVNIVNNQNLVLPPTGGSGPIPFTVGGIALCSIASLMYIDTMRKRRKEDKAS